MSEIFLEEDMRRIAEYIWARGGRAVTDTVHFEPYWLGYLASGARRVVELPDGSMRILN
jgi:hypothetical protein